MDSMQSSSDGPTASVTNTSNSQQTTSGGGSPADETATSFSNASALSSEAATPETAASQTLTTAGTVAVSSQSGGKADSDSSNISDETATSLEWSASIQSQGHSTMLSTEDGLLSSGSGNSPATTTMLEPPSSRGSGASNDLTTGTVSGSMSNDGELMTASTPSSLQSATTEPGGAITAGTAAGTSWGESVSVTYASTLQESTESTLSGTIAESSTETSLPESLPHDSGQTPQGTSASQSSGAASSDASDQTTSSISTTLAIGSDPGDSTSSQGADPGAVGSSRAGAEDSSTGDGSHSISIRYTTSSAGGFESMLSSSTLSLILSGSFGDGETQASTTATAQLPIPSTASESPSFESNYSQSQASVSSGSILSGQSNPESYSNGATMGTMSAATPTSGNSEEHSAGSGPFSGSQGAGTSAMTSNPESGVWQGTGPESSLGQIISSSQLFRDSSTSPSSPGSVSQQTNSQSVNLSPTETSPSARSATPVPDLNESQDHFSTSVATSGSETQFNNGGWLTSEGSNSNWASLSRSQGSDDSTLSYAVASGVQTSSASSLSQIDVATQQATDSGASETISSPTVTISTPGGPILGNSTSASSISQQSSPPSGDGLSPAYTSATLVLNTSGTQDRVSTADFTPTSEIAPSGSRSLESGAAISSDSKASSVMSDSYSPSFHSSISSGTASIDIDSASRGVPGGWSSATNSESPTSGGHESLGSITGSAQTALSSHQSTLSGSVASSVTKVGSSESSDGTGSIVFGSGAASTDLGGSQNSGFSEFGSSVKSNTVDVGWQESSIDSPATSGRPSQGGLDTLTSTGAVAPEPGASTNLMGSTNGIMTAGSLTMQSVSSGAESGGEANNPSPSDDRSTLPAGQATGITTGPTSPTTEYEPGSSWSLGSHSSQSNLSPQLLTSTQLSSLSISNSSLISDGIAEPGVTTDESETSVSGAQTEVPQLSGSLVSPGNNYQGSSITTLTRRTSISTERRVMTSDGSVKVSVIISYTSTFTLSVASDRLDSSKPEGPTPGLSPAPDLPEPTGNGLSVSREAPTSQDVASLESQASVDDLPSVPISPTSSSCQTTMMVYLFRETTTVSWGVVQTTVTETETDEAVGYDCLLYSTMIMGDRNTTLSAGEIATVTWLKPAPSPGRKW